MTHEELKQKVFSLAKNLEGIYDIAINTVNRYKEPFFYELTGYQVILKFDPWIRNTIVVEGLDDALLIKELEEAISQPTNEVVEQLNSKTRLF